MRHSLKDLGDLGDPMYDLIREGRFLNKLEALYFNKKPRSLAELRGRVYTCSTSDLEKVSSDMRLLLRLIDIVYFVRQESKPRDSAAGRRSYGLDDRSGGMTG